MRARRHVGRATKLEARPSGADSSQPALPLVDSRTCRWRAAVALHLLPPRGMWQSTATPKEVVMAKRMNLAKLCWTVMALGAVMFLTHSAILAFAR